MLYLLAVMFCLHVVNDYLRAQDARAQLHKFARRIAVLGPPKRYPIRTDRDCELTDSVPDPREPSDDA